MHLITQQFIHLKLTHLSTYHSYLWWNTNDSIEIAFTKFSFLGCTHTHTYNIRTGIVFDVISFFFSLLFDICVMYSTEQYYTLMKIVRRLWKLWMLTTFPIECFMHTTETQKLFVFTLLKWGDFIWWIKTIIKQNTN